MKELQSRVLKFLMELNGDRPEFELDKALANLSISREEFEETLFSLQDEGYLQIARIPVSNISILKIRSRLKVLDSSFILGELSLTEYQNNYSGTIGMISTADSGGDLLIGQELDLLPFPPIILSDIVERLVNTFTFIEELNDMKGNVSSETYTKLLDEYSEEYKNSISLLKRFVEASYVALENIKEKLEELRIEYESLEVDSKIRKSNIEDELKTTSNELHVLLNKTDKIANITILSRNISDDNFTSIQKELEDLKKKLQSREEERKIYEARILIEGDTVAKDYNQKLKALEEEINTITMKISEISAKIRTYNAKSNVRREIDLILEKANKLKKIGLSDDKNFSILSDVVKSLNKLNNILTKIKKVKESNIPLLEITSSIMQILKDTGN